LSQLPVAFSTYGVKNPKALEGCSRSVRGWKNGLRGTSEVLGGWKKGLCGG